MMLLLNSDPGSTAQKNFMHGCTNSTVSDMIDDSLFLSLSVRIFSNIINIGGY